MYCKVVRENFKNIKELEDSDADGKETLPLNKLLLDDEKEILHQIECGYEPVVHLSKFTQEGGVIIFD